MNLGGRGMIKTKEFYGGGVARIDEQITEFLQEGKRQLIDIKLIGVNNTFTTQCDYVALLIYREESK